MIPEEIREDAVTAIKDIMKKEGVDDYKYDIRGQSDSGENYMGEVIFINVETKDKKRKGYHWVMKTAKRSKDLRAALPIHLFYNRELYIYSTVFPNYRKFTKEVAPDFGFDFVPKVYWISEENLRETIVMENLKNEGFSLHNRKKPWNFQHSSFVMKHYGKLHALSMALRDQKPELYEEMEKNLRNISKAMAKSFDFRGFHEEPLKHIMSLLRKIGREDLVKKYDGVVEKAIVVRQNQAAEEDRLAICHMDCWNNNFMFKYKKNDETDPSDIRLLDFQLAVIDSPAKDLSYNIYSTCDQTCLSRFDELLQIYHDSVMQSLRKLGSDPSKFFSMADLRRHWSKYGLYGLFFTITQIKIELLDDDDAPDIEEMAESGNIKDCFNVKVADPEEYNRRILDVFVHFGDNFL